MAPTRRLTEADVSIAAEILRSGGLVALPTETVYGLGANALDAAAVERIFIAKDRPRWDPLIVHISSAGMLPRIVRHVPPRARLLMDRLWPGPLTLLLPRHPGLPLAVTAGRDLVGVRMPAHPVARAIIEAAGVPVAAPSANRFGHISPTTAEHVLDDLDGRIDAVLDAGACSIGLESTVLDPDPSPMLLYRQGGVSLAEIVAIAGPAEAFQTSPDASESLPESLPSPGVGIRHYAPRAHLLLADGEGELAQLAAAADPATTAVLLPADWSLPGFDGKVYRWQGWANPPALASTLYNALRTLDGVPGVRTILCPLPPATGRDMSDALRDRLLKAARSK